jgi:5-amino-6-(5-phosphoribosylamino)uracil reductase
MTEPSDLDLRRLREAIALGEKCPPSATFRVGAVITDADGAVLATGHSGESHSRDHAEEAALATLAEPAAALAIYSSLEPCSSRASRPVSCTEHILASPIRRVVFAWREPELFTDCEGAERLRAAGRTVIEVPELAHLVRRTNSHLPGVSADRDP